MLPSVSSCHLFLAACPLVLSLAVVTRAKLSGLGMDNELYLDVKEMHPRKVNTLVRNLQRDRLVPLGSGS